MISHWRYVKDRPIYRYDFIRISRITSIYNYVLIRVIRGDSSYGYPSLWTSKHGQGFVGFKS